MPSRLISLLTAAIAAAAAACCGVVSGAAASSAAGQLVCSRDDRQPITDARPGAPATPLVPRGAQTLTICNYNGMNATPSTPQFGLLGSLQTEDAATISQITAELDAIKPSPAGASYNCPMDDASDAILYFSYGSADVAVTVDTKGCNNISSGSIRRLGLDAPVVEQIQKLAKPVNLEWATVVGRIRLCGGPITPSGKTRCWTSADANVSEVQAVNSSNLWTAMAQLHRGRFKFRIASPGSYTFKLIGNGSANDATLARKRATVKVGRTTRIVLLVSVP
jgi:hypothetical protein